MELHTIGIDLGKTVFHLVGLSLRGEVVVRKRFSRKQLLHFTANLQVELIGMEACGGAHFLGRALRGHGHTVRLMPAQYVKPRWCSRLPTTPRNSLRTRRIWPTAWAAARQLGCMESKENRHRAFAARRWQTAAYRPTGYARLVSSQRSFAILTSRSTSFWEELLTSYLSCAIPLAKTTGLP